MLLVGGPGIGRLPIAPPTMMGFALQLALGWLLFVPLLWWDRKTLGRFHWASKLGFGLTVLASALPLVLMSMPAWEKVAAGLPGV